MSSFPLEVLCNVKSIYDPDIPRIDALSHLQRQICGMLDDNEGGGILSGEISIYDFKQPAPETIILGSERPDKIKKWIRLHKDAPYLEADRALTAFKEYRKSVAPASPEDRAFQLKRMQYLQEHDKTICSGYGDVLYQLSHAIETLRGRFLFGMKLLVLEENDYGSHEMHTLIPIETVKNANLNPEQYAIITIYYE